MNVGTKKAPSAGALCARSVASADLHRHTHYGSPSIPPRLTATTSGFLLYLATITIAKPNTNRNNFVKEPKVSSNSSAHHLISDYQQAFITNPSDRFERDYHSRIVGFYERNSDAPRFAFVDETYRPPKVSDDGYGMHQGFYSMTAVIVEADQVKNLRDALTNLQGDFYHANRVSLDRSQALLELVHQQLPPGAAIITVGTAVDYSPDADTQVDFIRQARHSNMLSLIQQGQDRDNPVYAFVFERMRNDKENQLDLEAISNFIQAGLIEPIDRIQVSPSAERLLWTPDAVCYAVQKVLNSSDYTLFETIKDNLEVYDALSHRYLDLAPGQNQQTQMNALNIVAATVPIEKLSDGALMQVASGRFVREEVVASLSHSLPEGQGRILQPKAQEGVGDAYSRAQAQGHQHQLSPAQAVAQSIARGDMTPRQKQAFEELNRRGTPIPPALQAVKTSYERMERAREQILGSNDQRQQNQGQQQRRNNQQRQQSNQNQRDRRQERRRDQNQQQNQNQRRNGPRR